LTARIGFPFLGFTKEEKNYKVKKNTRCVCIINGEKGWVEKEVRGWVGGGRGGNLDQGQSKCYPFEYDSAIPSWMKTACSDY